MSKDEIAVFADEVSKIIPHIIRGIVRKQGDPWGLGKITIPQYLSLDLINQHKSLKMKDIAKELNVSLPAASGLINRLYTLGMVKRLYDNKDRRVIYIEITPKGRKIVDQVYAHRKKALKDTFSKLTKEERSQYLNLLKRIKTTLYPET